MADRRRYYLFLSPSLHEWLDKHTEMLEKEAYEKAIDGTISVFLNVKQINLDNIEKYKFEENQP